MKNKDVKDCMNKPNLLFLQCKVSEYDENSQKYSLKFKGCFAFEINPELFKTRSPKERKKEERRIKRLKKQGKIPLDYDEWRKATNQPFMTGLGNEDGYDDYLSEFYNDFGGV